MQFHELEAFEAVAANRSFTRAAEALFLTQPAVTRQIASLERELKTRLFDRLGRVVALTTAGEALHRYAAEILRLIHEAERTVGDVVTGSAGRVAVGANSTTATYLNGGGDQSSQVCRQIALGSRRGGAGHHGVG